MAAAADEALSKVDSLNETPQEAPKKAGRRASSMAADVYNIEDLGKFFETLYFPYGSCS